MEQILLVDKPQGITSFGVVARVRRLLGAAKVGHAGTLDPMATGLLVLGIGEGTKKLAEYLKLPKTYEATIRLGVRTTTSDLDGEVLEERAVAPIRDQEARAVIEELAGTLTLPVSAYSAIKQGGVPLYKKARRGEAVVLPMREMEIREAEYLGSGYTDISAYPRGAQRGTVAAVPVFEIRARFDVGSGTYIRSLAEEVGRRLSVPATLAALRRTRVGGFRVEDAATLEQLEQKAAAR